LFKFIRTFPAFRGRVVAAGLSLLLAISVVAEAAAPAAEPPTVRTPPPLGPSPKLHYLVPNTGPREGGTLITLHGENFALGQEGKPALIVVGEESVPVADVKVISRGKIVFRTPPMKSGGSVDLRLTNPDGQSVGLQRAFYFGGGLRALVYRLRLRFWMVWRYVRIGGSIMYVLLLMSLFALAWALHCGLTIRQPLMVPARFVEVVTTLLSRGEWKGAEDLCRRENCAFSRIVRAGLQAQPGAAGGRSGRRFAGRRAADVERLHESIAAAGSREAARLQQRVSYLSNVGVIAPMLGLLGTVIGLALAFESMREVEQRSVYLAGAVAMAMNTTVAGLLVGIPAMALYYFLRAQALNVVLEMETAAEEVIQALRTKDEEEPTDEVSARSGAGGRDVPDRPPD